MEIEKWIGELIEFIKKANETEERLLVHHALSAIKSLNHLKRQIQ